MAAFGDLTRPAGHSARPARWNSCRTCCRAQTSPMRWATRSESNHEFGANAGVDARYRLTSSMMLSATINPDFGQVEVDPAIINSDRLRGAARGEAAVLRRRRPRTSGSAATSTGRAATPPRSSTRAASAVHRSSAINAAQSEAPGVTSILGAAKISGKTASGWSIGVLDAITGKEERPLRERELDSPSARSSNRRPTTSRAGSTGNGAAA